jgi:hypothetical protein
MPADVNGRVLPPIPLSETIGMLYCLHGFIDDKYLECAKETEPHESNLTSFTVLTNLRCSSKCLIRKFALLISVEPGDIIRSSERKISQASLVAHPFPSTGSCH